MLTPHSKDPNRKEELERKKFQPESFGRTSIPPMAQIAPIAISDDESAKLLEEAAQHKEEMRTARNDLIAKREALQLAESNLADAVKKEAKPAKINDLTEKRDVAAEEVNTAEEVLNDLIDA